MTDLQPMPEVLRQAKASPAIHELEKEIARDPDAQQWQVLKNLASSMIDDLQKRYVGALIRRKDFASALRRLASLVAESPRNISWRYLQAHTYEASGDMLAALEARKTLVEITPGSNAYHMHVCRTLIDLKEFRACLEYADLGMAVQIDKSRELPINCSQELRLLAGRALYGLGRYEEAIKMVKRLPRKFFHWSDWDPLMDRSELIKACEAALESR